MKSIDLQGNNDDDNDSDSCSHLASILEGVLLKYIETFREDLGQDAIMDSFDKFDDGVILFKITQVVIPTKNSFIEVNSSNKSFLSP